MSHEKIYIIVIIYVLTIYNYFHSVYNIILISINKIILKKNGEMQKSKSSCEVFGHNLRTDP